MADELFPGNRSIPPFAREEFMTCIAPHETFDGTWPFKPNFFTGNGFRQHYVDEGRENEANGTIVMLHGEPTWGYLSVRTPLRLSTTPPHSPSPARVCVPHTHARRAAADLPGTAT